MQFRSPDPLPDDVIDRLFSALTVRYGAPFLDRWRDLDLTVIKGDWARELATFGSNLSALRFALDHLPEKPPTVIEFKKLAAAMPTPDVPRIDPKPGHADKDRLAHALHRMTERAKAGRGERQWAYDLIADHENGNPRAQACVVMARAAIAKDRGLPLGAWEGL